MEVRMKRAIEIYCSLCYSQAYEMCKNIDGTLSSYTHSERFEDAMSNVAPIQPPGMKEAAFLAEDGF